MSDIRAVAKQYIESAWSVVPLNPGEKRASVKWQSTTYKPSDFNDDSNIAVKMGDASNGLVDVDCDHPFAVAAAKELLPITGRVFGRSSKPSSHYLFVCPDIKTTQFTDVKATDGTSQMLVEIRSTNGYTMLPPSIHPSGERVVWERERDLMQRTPDELFADVRAVAIAALVAVHYPGHGARHFCIGQHLPGFLLQAKLDAILVKRIIEAAAKLGADSDWEDRRKAIDATIAKVKNGEPVTGGPKLADAIGAEVVAKMRAWLKMADLDALEDMNSKHFFVRLGSKSVIGREDSPEGVIFQPVRELYPVRGASCTTSDAPPCETSNSQACRAPSR
jgi:putative DNA primase/helicase